MNRTKLRAMARFVLGVTLAGAGLAQARCQINPVELPVKMVGMRPIATVGLNGKQVPLLLDTGAFFSMLMASTAAELNLKLLRSPYQISGLNGRIDAARLTTVDHVKFLDGELKDIEFLVGGNEIGETAMGVIGRNILSAVDMEYDLAHGVVRFVMTNDDCAHANMAYWAGDTPVSEVALLPQRQRMMGNAPIRAVVKLNGHDTIALFDTGAMTVVSLSGAHSAGIKDADMKADGEMFGAGRGKARNWSAAFDSVSLGGETVQHNRLAVADYDAEDHDMLIGVDFFLSHHIYVSARKGRMFFTYNGGAVFAQNRSLPPAAAASASGDADKLSADQYARRGAASISRKDLPSALADLDRACALDPANADFLVTRAELHMRMGHDALAKADLDAALQLDPASTRALMDRAELHSEARQFDLAAVDLDAVDKRLTPQSHDRFELATQYERIHRPEAALAQWTTWLAAHPHDIRREAAFNARCWERTTLDRDLALAMKDCEEALDAAPKNASYVDSRGWLWLRLGEPAKARADFDQAIALRAKMPTSLYGRGIVRLRQGDTAGAQADFAAARGLRHAIDADLAADHLPLAPDATPERLEAETRAAVLATDQEDGDD